MTTDLTIGLANRPGTLAGARDALGRAGINIEGAAGLVLDDRPVLHVLVADAERAERAVRALIDAGFDILDRRQVLAVPIENAPGTAATLLRRLADAGANLELVYTTLDGRVVLGSSDTAALRAALA
jgi:hypothetical protein